MCMTPAFSKIQCDSVDSNCSTCQGGGATRVLEFRGGVIGHTRVCHPEDGGLNLNETKTATEIFTPAIFSLTEPS